MNGYEGIARLLKERENERLYSPVIGTITALPELSVRINQRIVLDKTNIDSIVNLAEQNEETHEFINLGKRAVLLPYRSYQKYICIGVLAE